MAKNPVSQSDTRWVKKTGKKGYVEQISTGKRVTGRVALVKDTTKGKAGSTQRYKKGTGLKQIGAKPAAAGGGRKPGRASTSSAPSTSASAPTVTKVKVGTVRRGAAGRQDNRWNGTKWVPVVSKRAPAKANPAAHASGGKPAVAQKPPRATGSRTATSGTVASAVAQGNRAGRDASPGRNAPLWDVVAKAGTLIASNPGDRYNKTAKRWETYKNGKWVSGRKSS